MMDLDKVLLEYDWIINHRSSVDINSRIAKLLLSFVVDFPTPSSIENIFGCTPKRVADAKDMPQDVVPLVIFRDLIHNHGIIYDQTTTTNYVGMEVNPFSLFSRKYKDVLFAKGKILTHTH